MGGAESKTIINNLSEQISNIAMSTVQNCEITSTQEQNLEYNNTGLLFWGNTKVEQTTEIKNEGNRFFYQYQYYACGYGFL